jgi:Flp pilus assembly protein TadG
MRRFRNERGTASLELALVTPALMLLVLGVLQFGLWYHAEHVARTAALEAARTASAEDGSAEAARNRGFEVLDAGLGKGGTDQAVSVDIGSDAAHVTVTARIGGLLPIPGLSSFALHGEAVAYRERFRPAGESP